MTSENSNLKNWAFWTAVSMKKSELFVGDHVSACVSLSHSNGSSRPEDHIRAGGILGYLLSCGDSFKSIFISTYK